MITALSFAKANTFACFTGNQCVRFRRAYVYAKEVFHEASV
jgi:hypothetical protein